MRRRERDRGSALMLMPAAVLIIVVLAAIAVDFAVAFLAERELANATAAAANDAAGQAIDDALFQSTGQVVIDPDLAARTAAAALAARRLEYIDDLEWDVEVTDAGHVVVRAKGSVGTIFAKAIPGGPVRTAVDAQSRARTIER